MSKYYEIDSQQEIKVHEVPNKNTYTHNGKVDVGRLIYSQADQRLCIGTLSSWIPVSTPYDILDQNTKVLFGSYPLPVGWNLDITDDDKVGLITNTASEIGTSGGDWTISGMVESGEHDHITGAGSLYILHRGRGYYGMSLTNHTHTISNDGGHIHSMGHSWRPYHIKYCVAEYQ